MNLYGKKQCDECHYVKPVVELGPVRVTSEPMQDNLWMAWICEDCLRAGLALFPESAPPEKPTVRQIRRWA